MVVVNCDKRRVVNYSGYNCFETFDSGLYQLGLSVFGDADVDFLHETVVFLNSDLFVVVFVVVGGVQSHLDVEVTAEVDEVEDVETSEHRNSLQNCNANNLVSD